MCLAWRMGCKENSARGSGRARLLGNEDGGVREVVDTVGFIGHVKGSYFAIHVLGRFQKF